jgi:methylated-DNA-[protein]-cysteine S-methyltransferase
MIKAIHHSPIGDLTMVSDGRGLCAVVFENHWKTHRAVEEAQTGEDAVLTKTRRQFDDYFAGRRTRFDIPLTPHGTLFQRSVWKLLREIEPGATTTYSALAQTLGKPNAVRAVGGAVGRNPISIIVPCHRVVGANGSLTGFAGGIERKRFLLEHESALRAAA